MSDPPRAPARGGSLIALAIVAALLGGGVWLVRKLGDLGAVQDCAAQGLRDCGRMETAPH